MSKEEDNQLKVNNNQEEKSEGNQTSTPKNPFNEKDEFVFTDSNEAEPVANVVNSPVEITSTSEIEMNEAKIDENSSKFWPKMKTFLQPLIKKFLSVGEYVQGLISKFSEKIQVKQSYKYCLIFLALGVLLFLFALFYIPFVIFNPGKLLRLLSFANIFIMLCFLFYYGSQEFFAFLIDKKRTGIMFGHLLAVCSSLFVSLFIGGYFLQLLLDIILCITTVMFILTLIPGGQEGIKGIQRMLISPMLLILNNFKNRFTEANNSDSS